MRIIIALFFCVIAGRSYAQDPLHIGNWDSLYSQKLGEKRYLMVSVPSDAQPGRKYPVAYLLDAEQHFHLFTAAARHVGESGNSLAPDMIVVGIINTDRTRDFTPGRDSNFPFPSGGAEKFSLFLEQELIPYIESKYPARPYRLLAGHSFGGLFVMHSLFSSQAFKAYLSVDPSMHWNNSKLLKETPSILRSRDLAEKRLYLAIARPFPDLDSGQARRDQSNSTVGFRTVIELNEALAADSSSGLEWSSRYYPGEYHSHLPYPAYYDGLKAVFRFYKRPILHSLDNSSAEKLINHYKSLSGKMGYEVQPREDLISGYCWRYRSEKRSRDGLVFLLKLKEAYPALPGIYEEMALMYRELGDVKKANELSAEAAKMRSNNPR